MAVRSPTMVSPGPGARATYENCSIIVEPTTVTRAAPEPVIAELIGPRWENELATGV